MKYKKDFYNSSSFLFFVIALLDFIAGMASLFFCQGYTQCLFSVINFVSIIFFVLIGLAVLSCILFIWNIYKDRNWLKKDTLFKVLSGILQLLYLIYIIFT